MIKWNFYRRKEGECDNNRGDQKASHRLYYSFFGKDCGTRSGVVTMDMWIMRFGWIQRR